jgi:hypothetical protein
MKRALRWQSFIWLGLTSLFLVRFEGRADEKASLKAIADAWARRQAAAKTVRIVWKQEATNIGLRETLAAMNRSRRSSPKQGAKAEEGRPASVVKLARSNVLCLDGDQFAYSYDMEGLDAVNSVGSRADIPSHYKIVLTGSAYTTFSDRRSRASVPDIQTALVTISDSVKCDEPKMPDVRPLFVSLRPLSRQLSFINLSEYAISPIRATVGSTTCIVLEPSDKSAIHGTIKSFWVDPARDYIIVRMVNAFREGTIQTDIVYDKNAVLGWIPKSWSFIHADAAGRLLKMGQSGVREFVVNEPIAATEFEIDQPLGAQLNDEREGHKETHRVGLGPAIDTPEGSGRLRFVVTMNILLICALGAVVAVRRFRRFRNPPN